MILNDFPGLHVTEALDFASSFGSIVGIFSKFKRNTVGYYLK